MQLHNGSVEFESEPGQGTVFHLRFPATEQVRAGHLARRERARRKSPAS